MAAIAPPTPASPLGLPGPCRRSPAQRRQSKAKAALPRAWPWPAAADAARRDGGDGAEALQDGAGGAPAAAHAPAQGGGVDRSSTPVLSSVSDRPVMLQRKHVALVLPGDANLELREPWLPAAPAVANPRSVHNAASLAYLGDALYELYARLHFFAPQRIEAYSDRVTAVVCCEAQHSLLCALLEDDFLTEGERDVLRWGRNVTTGQRRAKGRAGSAVYSSATSLETLNPRIGYGLVCGVAVGYLYLTDKQRLEELMAQLGFYSGQASRA
eukprot:SM000001S04434  [mRNA]  locus=s1:179730:181768:- [translate_table: standard]